MIGRKDVTVVPEVVKEGSVNNRLTALLVSGQCLEAATPKMTLSTRVKCDRNDR